MIAGTLSLALKQDVAEIVVSPVGVPIGPMSPAFICVRDAASPIGVAISSDVSPGPLGRGLGTLGRPLPLAIECHRVTRDCPDRASWLWTTRILEHASGFVQFGFIKADVVTAYNIVERRPFSDRPIFGTLRGLVGDGLGSTIVIVGHDVYSVQDGTVILEAWPSR